MGKPSGARKKGAAQAICQAPSNKMLGTSSFACASCVLSLMVCLWPLVFTKARSWYTGVFDTELPILLLLPLLVGAFLYNGVIAVGAVKMQSAESYSWAMMASMLSVAPVSWVLAVPAFLWFYKLLGQILPGDLTMSMVTVGCIGAWYVYVGLW